MKYIKPLLHKTIITIGFPGSGKTTLIKNLAEVFTLSAIEIGNINRELVEFGENLELKKKILSQYYNTGDRDPKIIMEIMQWYINTHIKEEIKNGLIIDGLKNMNEIKHCKELLKSYGVYTVDIILILHINKETAIKRLNNRGSRTYNSSYKPIFDYRFQKMEVLIQQIQKNRNIICNNLIILDSSQYNTQEIFNLLLHKLK